MFPLVFVTYTFLLLVWSSNFLVNSADRVIRVFDIDVIMASCEEEVEALQRLQDLVNRYVDLSLSLSPSELSGRSVLSLVMESSL